MSTLKAVLVGTVVPHSYNES